MNRISTPNQTPIHSGFGAQTTAHEVIGDRRLHGFIAVVTGGYMGTSTELEGMGGVYCEDADIAEAVAADSSAPRGVRPWATDRSLAERLWTKSEEWTRVTFAA